jgi:hypothetical protein
MVAKSLCRLEWTSAAKSSLSVLMRRRRVYHGGSWRVSNGLVQQCDKQTMGGAADVQREVRCRKESAGIFSCLSRKERSWFALVDSEVVI